MSADLFGGALAQDMRGLEHAQYAHPALSGALAGNGIGARIQFQTTGPGLDQAVEKGRFVAAGMDESRGRFPGFHSIRSVPSAQRDRCCQCPGQGPRQGTRDSLYCG